MAKIKPAPQHTNPSLHLILQGKGGVGKSYIAALLAQHFSTRGVTAKAIDTDPVNATFASYEAFKAKPLEIMHDDNIDPRAFDSLMETIVGSKEGDVFVIDNGAATFIPLCAYLFENNVLEFLNNQNINICFHTVLTGGQALDDTTAGLAKLFENFPTVQVCVWINEFFGKLEKNGKSFEDLTLYKKHQSQIHGIIRIPEVRKETFGHDVDQMLRNKLTFSQAIESSDFNIMAKQRLTMVWHEINNQINNLQL